MLNKRPCALSIAGFDPSGGAGVLADIKTFEALGIYGFGICSAITVQNDISFKKVAWLDLALMEEQFRVLTERFEIPCVKIGLIENLQTLAAVIGFLKAYDKDIKIICDPVLKASAGFDFHPLWELKNLEEICKNLFLLTPNRDEIKKLLPGLEAGASAEQLSKYCAVLLKDGHGEGEEVLDKLYAHKAVIEFPAKRIINGAKHGSGCVLSAAVTGYIAIGNGLQEACNLARNYMNAYLSSTESLLGFHAYKEKECLT